MLNEKRENKFKINKYNKENVSKEFINEIKSVERLYVAHEEYGNITEFYDEDGVVVLTIDVKSGAEDDALVFNFPLSNKQFKISEEDFEFEVGEDESSMM